MRTRLEWADVMGFITVGHVHDGDSPVSMYDSGLEDVGFLRDCGCVRDGDSILDVGCGNGRFAVGFSQMRVSYTGVDVIPESVAFCSRVFAPYGFTFARIDTGNPHYHVTGAVAPDRVTLPGGPYDCVVAHSLFTHLERLSVCRRYVQEIEHVLRPGGMFYSTWFRSPPNAVSDSAERTVLREEDIRGLLRAFTVTLSLRGDTDEYHDQWRIVARKN